MKQPIKRKFIVIFILLFITLSFYEANRLIEPVMIAKAKQEVQASLLKIVHNCIAHLEFQENELYAIQKNPKDEITNINYNSYALNQVLYDAIENINQSMNSAIKGDVDPITKQIYFDEGIIEELPLGYFTELAFFTNIGPMIKIKVRSVQSVSGNYEIYNEPYGINNTLLKITLKVKIKADIFAGISRETIEMVEEIPIVLQLIQGVIPQYVPLVNPH